MAVQTLTLRDAEASWPQLEHLAGFSASRFSRLVSLLASEGAYALVTTDGEVIRGLALVEQYPSAWIFDDHIAAIREWAAADEDARQELLAAIDARARAAGMTHLSRFIEDSQELPWWLGAGFSEYMTALRRQIDEAVISPPASAFEGIDVRAVTDVDKDWPQLWPLLAALDEHHASLTGRPLHQHREERTRAELREEVASGNALVLIAEAGERAIATSSAELGEPHADGSRTGYRSKLFIDPAYRGRGLAARFEETAVRWLRQKGATHIERWIVAGNQRPRQIWEARGYRPSRFLLRRTVAP